MSFPAEGVELGFRNHIEDVRTFLDSRHPDHYTVFNLSPKYYRSAKFHNRVSAFHGGKFPRERGSSSSRTQSLRGFRS